MAGVPKIRSGDTDRTYEAVDANVAGGQLVVPSTTATESTEPGATPAGANAINVLGVAATDAVTAANRAALVATSGGGPGAYPYTDVSVPPATFTVYSHCETKVQYLAGTAVAFNAPIKAAATGQVTLWVAGTDAPERAVGRCRVKGGMGTGGGVGEAFIAPFVGG